MPADDRIYPIRPICGVGVVAFSGDQVLLVQRGKEPRRGEWSIPGGAVELGETVREAALREFSEECGGEVELRDVLDAVDAITYDETGRVQYHYVIIDFWGEWQGGTLRAQSDIMDARWVVSGDLDSYALQRWTREVIDKAIVARGRG
ncbi:MAG: NUDIX hydrolase [Anaerolineae bacterium]